MKLNKTQQFHLEVTELIKQKVTDFKLNCDIKELYYLVEEKKKNIRNIKKCNAELIILVVLIQQFDMSEILFIDVVLKIKKFFYEFKFIGTTVKDFIPDDVIDTAVNKFYKDNPKAVEMDKQLNSILNLLSIKRDEDIEELLQTKWAKFKKEYGGIYVQYRTPGEKKTIDKLTEIMLDN